MDKGKGRGKGMESDHRRDPQLDDGYNAKRAGVVDLGDLLQDAFNDLLWRIFWSRACGLERRIPVFH